MATSDLVLFFSFELPILAPTPLSDTKSNHLVSYNEKSQKRMRRHLLRLYRSVIGEVMLILPFVVMIDDGWIGFGVV